MESPLEPVKSNEDIIADLERLQGKMFDVAADMIYYGGFSEVAEKGDELLGASYVVAHWVREMKQQLKSKTSPRP